MSYTVLFMIIFFRQGALGDGCAECNDHETDDNCCNGRDDETHTKRMAVGAADKQIGVKRRYELSQLRYHGHDGNTKSALTRGNNARHEREQRRDRHTTTDTDHQTADHQHLV